MASATPFGTPAQIAAMRKHVMGRLEALRSDRWSWMDHWRQVARYTLPRRLTWLSNESNKSARGSMINGAIIDETALLALRTLRSGMMSGMSSPARPWIKLKLANVELAEGSPVKVWLDEATKRLATLLSNSNYYPVKAQQYEDLGAFGTSPMIIYEDEEDVIRCYGACAGEFFVYNNSRMEPGGLYREFVRSAAQIVDEFGDDNVSDAVREAYRAGGGAVQTEFTVCHAIEENDVKLGAGLVPKMFPWREVYWEQAGQADKFLRVKGFHEQPFSCPRWDLAGNDAYGRSPGMDALPANMQLQQEQRRKAEVIDKGARPPMIADVQMKNEPLSQIPGGVVYVSNAAGVGYKPAFMVEPAFVSFIMQDIQQVQQRIQQIFFADLFMMISQLDSVRTATEIDARREEKLIQLGPVLERHQNEGFDPEVDRIFGIMVRRSQPAWARGEDGLLPPPPPELQSVNIEIEYVSMLATAQRAANTAAMERLAGFVGNLGAGFPEALDKLDTDQLIDEYADALGVEAATIRAAAVVDKIRQARTQAQQQQMQMQNSMAAVQGAKTLSQVDVGGGQNAVQAMLGGGQAA